MDRVENRNKLAMLGASYDFGAVQPMLTLVRSTVAGVDHSNVSLAARVPLALGVVKLGVAKLNPDGAANDTTRWGAGAQGMSTS